MIGNVNQPSTSLIMDTDGTLKAGAVDVAAVVADGVLTGAKLDSTVVAPHNLCFDPFNRWLSPGAQWASKSRWYQYSAFSKIDPDTDNPFGCPTMRHLGTATTLAGKWLLLTDINLRTVSRGALVVKIPAGTSTRVYARYANDAGTWLGIANVGATVAGADSTEVLTCSIETPPAGATRLFFGINRMSGSGDCDIYAWSVTAGTFASTLVGQEADPQYLHQEIVDARGGLASLDTRLDNIETDLATETLASYLDVYGAHLLRAYTAKRAKINNGTAALLNIVCIGDSWTYGIANTLRSALQATYGAAGDGMLQFQSGYLTIGSSTIAYTGAWDFLVAAPTYGLGYQAVNSTDVATPAKITVTATGTDLIVHYVDQSGGGEFRYRVDAGAWTTIDTDGTEAYRTATISGLSSASHALEIEMVSAGSVGVTLVGVEVIDGSDGVIVNWCGHAGATADKYITNDEDRFAEALVAHNPDLITLQLGINDYADYPYSDFTTNMNTLIDRIQAALPATDILLITEPDVGAARTWPMSDYAAAVRSIATAQGVAMFDLHMNWGPYADGNARGLYVNPTHPTPQGYQSISDLLIDRMQM